MDNIKEFLISMGLGRNESEIYFDLVQRGASSVLEISKRTKIHRSNIYDYLRVLVGRGLVYEINGSTTMFSARSPDSLLNYFKEREAQLGELIKQYKGRFLKKDDGSKIRITKGLFAFREAIFDMLDNDSTIRVYGIPVEAPDKLGPILNDFHKERIRRGISMQQIYNSGAEDRVRYLNKMKFTEAKVLPAKYDSFATTNIAGDKVFILLWGEDMTVIEIDDKHLALPYGNYFNILWKKANKVD